MRIALITDGIWPYVLGGMQKHSYYLCKYLARQKIHIDLYQFNRSNYDIGKLEFFSEEERAFITSYIVDIPATLPLPGHYLLSSFRHSKLVYQEISSKLRSYDFIYTKGFTGWYLIEMKYRNRIACPPVGVNFHGYEMFQNPPDIKSRMQQMMLLRYPVKRISRRADFVFSYGGKITGIIRSLGIPDKRIIEMPAGIESGACAEGIKKTGDTIRFVFLGRYERRKGIEELNRAISGIENMKLKRPFEFHFIGPVPVAKQLRHNAVTYHGEVRDKEQLQILLRSCDILVCPSWSEGMPNVILEAMCNGLAVIATDVGATSLLVNDDTGWLLRSSDPGEIRQVMIQALGEDTKTLAYKKQHALSQSRNFDWNRLIKHLCEQMGWTV